MAVLIKVVDLVRHPGGERHTLNLVARGGAASTVVQHKKSNFLFHPKTMKLSNSG